MIRSKPKLVRNTQNLKKITPYSTLLSSANHQFQLDEYAATLGGSMGIKDIIRMIISSLADPSEMKPVFVDLHQPFSGACHDFPSCNELWRNGKGEPLENIDLDESPIIRDMEKGCLRLYPSGLIRQTNCTRRNRVLCEYDCINSKYRIRNL